MAFLRTLSGVNSRQFWNFGTIPLKINLAPAGIRTLYVSPEKAPTALPAIQYTVYTTWTIESIGFKHKMKKIK